MEAKNIFLSKALSYEKEKRQQKKERTNLIKPQFKKNIYIKDVQCRLVTRWEKTDRKTYDFILCYPAIVPLKNGLISSLCVFFQGPKNNYF